MHLRPLASALALSAALAAPATAQSSLVFNPPAGVKAQGKHVVFLSGDEEYRSEEAMPMLAKILSQRHGFKCTVLFALDADGTINPDNQKSLPDSQALDSADAIVMGLRFRNWLDADMQRFVSAFERGVPLIALRTSTHPFNFPAESKWAKYSYNARAPWPGGFGKHVIGETWVSHWGRHKFEATRGVAEPAAKDDPLLRGVTEVFGDSDVYEAYPPADAKILMRGLVLKGMNPADAPAESMKKRANDKQEQGLNSPAMPIAWTRTFTHESGKTNKIFTTTMGAATDLENESLRRFVVNSVFWATGLTIPAKADVAPVDPYTPRKYGFKGYRYQLKPSDYALGKTVPVGGTPPPAPPAKKQNAPAPKKQASASEGRAGPPGQPIVPGRPGGPALPQAAATPSLSSQPSTLSSALQLNPGDRVAIVGNALADRMQHHGWLETMIHAAHPAHQIVVRNLAAAGDEVVARARSKDFGTPDDWLNKVQAGVVFAFFGFNESFAGREGLPKFKEDLAAYLRDTRAKQYNGLATPRIVLFSPIAVEKHPDPNYEYKPEINANLALYTQAIEEVARDQAGVSFVNLFAPSQELYAEAAKTNQPPLTINGVHLSEAGEAKLAHRAYPALFGAAAPALDTPEAQKLRAVVNEKSAMWHSSYRSVDGYNIYGDRSKIAYVSHPDAPKITNTQVMMEEMAQRDVMTANLERRAWALAAGKTGPVEMLPLPVVTAFGTNKPGPNIDGTYPFEDGDEAIKLMTPGPGLKVNLFASEKEFPELAKPLQMAWDTKGRLWVSVWPSYPELTPTARVKDKLIILEDTDRDGRADKCTTFLDGLNCPTGFQFFKDGVLVMQAPDVWFVRDTDGDGKADWKERVLMGLDSADSHHTANSLIYEPGGAILFSDGVFHRTQVESVGGAVRNIDGALYRYEPLTGKFSTYVAYGFANPHGRAFDYWGNDIITDATGNENFFAPAYSGYLPDSIRHHGRMKQFWNRPSRPCAGTGILSSRHFPDEFNGNFLNCNVIGFQGIFRVKVSEEGSGLKGETLEDLVKSDDPNFRPSSVDVAPDGSVYFLDWAKPLIGHMQHHIRDPNRDKQHGRIYRLTYEGRPLLKPVKIDGQSIPALLNALKTPENNVRTRAKIELGKRDSAKVIGAVDKWITKLDTQDPAYEHHMMEALWVHQWHNVVDEGLLKRMLRSPEPRARAAATRGLCYWRDRVAGPLDLLKIQVNDAHPRVRLEAVRACSFFKTAKAAEIALEVLEKEADPSKPDYYIKYCLDETMKALDQYTK